MLLEQVERVNLFKVVINPDSFAQSAENIFYLSFLIRDAKVAFEIDDESGEPFVCASCPFFSPLSYLMLCVTFSQSRAKSPQTKSAQRPAAC